MKTHFLALLVQQTVDTIHCQSHHRVVAQMRYGPLQIYLSCVLGPKSSKSWSEAIHEIKLS